LLNSIGGDADRKHQRRKASLAGKYGALRTLQNWGLIDHDIDSRKYYITDTGKIFLQNEQLKEMLANHHLLAKYAVINSNIDRLSNKYSQGKVLTSLYGKQNKPALVLSSKDEELFEETKKLIKKTKKEDPLIFGHQKESGGIFLYNINSPIVNLPIEDLPFRLPLELSFITNNEVNAKKLFDKIEKDLKYHSEFLTSSVINAVGSLNGLESPFNLRGPKDIRVYDNYAWIRRAYDFELTLVLHVNGKALIDQVNWKTVLEKARKYDEEYQKKLLLQDMQLEDCWKNKRQLTLLEFMKLDLEQADIHGVMFRDRTPGDPLRWSIGYTQEELLENLAARIENTVEHMKGKATRKEIRDILDGMLENGDFEIVQTTMFSMKLKGSSAEESLGTVKNRLGLS
jgi:hypothetical protein